MQSFSMAKNWWQFLIMAVVSYFLGCINIARIIARKKHKDITKMGSGNPGTMNMSREFGWKVGVLTFLFDAAKGAIPVLVVHIVYKNYTFAGTLVHVSDVARYFCGLFAVLGHVLPVVYKFNGGKGIATTFGVFVGGNFLRNAVVYSNYVRVYRLRAYVYFYYRVGFVGKYFDNRCLFEYSACHILFPLRRTYDKRLFGACLYVRVCLYSCYMVCARKECIAIIWRRRT